MTVFSKIRGFFWRHKTKFIIGGVIFTGSIFLTKYAQLKLKEWQERETREFLERNRKQNHFESIGRTCDQTILNLSAALFDIIFKTVNTDEIIENLKMNPENKLEMWNHLKISVLSKSGLMIYSTVMLIVTLKIQLSIIGGYLYRDPNSVSTEMQEKYLSLCQNFLNLGIPKLSKLMETEVKKIVEHIDLKKQLRLSDVEAIYWSIQTSLATNNECPIDHFRNYIINEEEMPKSNDIYEKILQDTADLLDSDEVKSLTTHCVNRGFILLGDQIATFFMENGSSVSSAIGDQFLNPYNAKKPLAKLLPIINGLLSKQSLPQNLIQQLITNEKLQFLSANVYESLL